MPRWGNSEVSTPAMEVGGIRLRLELGRGYRSARLASVNPKVSQERGRNFYIGSCLLILGLFGSIVQNHEMKLELTLNLISVGLGLFFIRRGIYSKSS